MALLFIDSTYDITLGILDNDLSWVSFERFIGHKSSSILQKETNRLLTMSETEPASLEGVITVAGPGFYTGLRLSEGVADVFTFVGVPHYSFLSHHVPKYLGVIAGVWMTKAYRGEYFFYHWSGEGDFSKLVESKDLESYIHGLPKTNFFIHSNASLDELSKQLIPDFISTHDLLKNNSKDLFRSVLARNIKEDSYYFRAPEDEFRVGK